MLEDIADLLKTDAEVGVSSDLPTISVWRLAVYFLMFFTTRLAKFASHFDPDTRKSILCLDATCPACKAGLKRTEHIYLPAWDVQNHRIVVLRVDSRNDGPARQIAQFIETYRPKLHDVVAIMDCKGDGHGTFTITAHSPLAETDRGALACKAFCDGLEAGAINLRDCVQRLSAEDMAKVASVKKLSAKLVGGPVGLSVSAPPANPVVGQRVESQEAPS